MAHLSRAQSIDVTGEDQIDPLSESRANRIEEWIAGDPTECGETEGIDANQPCGVTQVLVYTCSVHRRNETAGLIESN